MSDIRKQRSEIRQGLHQFCMHLYNSYLQTHSEEEAKKLTTEAIKEQLGLFMASDSFSTDINEVLNGKLKSLYQKWKSTKGYEEALSYEQKVNAIELTLKVLGEE